MKFLIDGHANRVTFRKQQWNDGELHEFNTL